MITRRKIRYPVSDPLRQYLRHFDRERDTPKVYSELLRFSGAIPYADPEGKEAAQRLEDAKRSRPPKQGSV